MEGTAQVPQPLAGPTGASGRFSPPDNGRRLTLTRCEFDAHYVRRLAEGDRSTEDHFVTYFSEFLGLKLRSRLRSLEAIEDVRQETFARIFRVLREQGGIDHPERLGGFVNSVCNNVLFEKFREYKRYGSMDTPSDELPDDRIEVDKPLIDEERKCVVSRVLAKLRRRDVDLLRMVFLEEVDRADACRRLGISQSGLRVVLHRAVVRFRKAMTEDKAAGSGRLDSRKKWDYVKQQGDSVHYRMGHVDGT